MSSKNIPPVVIAQEGDAVAMLNTLGIAPEILEALDNRALAVDGFTGVECETVAAHWVFAARFAGRALPSDNGLVVIAVAKSLMCRAQFVAHVKSLLGCDITLDGESV